jgi:hypothetical protein
MSRKECEIARCFQEAFSEFASENGLTLQEAWDAAMTPPPNKTWGRLPHEYDPRLDESHPGNGAFSERMPG